MPHAVGAGNLEAREDAAFGLFNPFIYSTVALFGKIGRREDPKPVGYVGTGCIGCGICFYNCPEPYALRVVKGER